MTAKSARTPIYFCTLVLELFKKRGLWVTKEACDGDPFNDFPIVKNIVDAVGEMETVKASNSKFSECPI